MDYKPQVQMQYTPENDPWGAAREVLAKRDREAEIQALLKAGMLDVPTMEKMRDTSVPAIDALSESPAFLDKAFPKGKKKK